MNGTRLLVTTLILAGSLCGCTNFSAREADHRFKLNAPDRIQHGDLLTFSVEMTTVSGEQVSEETTYGWILDWPDVKGMMRMGRAYEELHQEARCSPGTAVLRIYAKNPSNRIVQVLRKEIQVD